MIKLSCVTKQYLYGARVIDALDMEIKDGEIIAVLGDTGSGKTTFIKVASAVEDCEGEVLLDGKPMTQKTDDTIVLFDDLALFDNKNFYYNLAFPLAIRGYDAETIEERVYFAADRLGITACLKDKVKKSTLLDRKRLGVARLLLRDAKAVFVDDITSGLSASEAKIILDEIRPILINFAKRGASVVYSTPSRDETKAISDRVVVLHYGEVKQIGSYDEIYSHPANVWAGEAVDEFFAFEEARLERVDGKLELIFKGEEQEYILPATSFEGRVIEDFVGSKVYVGWHGEDYDIDGARKEEVEYSYRLGDKYVNVTKSGKKIVCDKKFDEVGTLPNIEKAYLFDFANENSITK
ncbi:MAG: ABC transporter ATP-binding protein [Clostridia bacterium]|nr:ABC transporter ATP-binding protein [Clostridia bacterium]